VDAISNVRAALDGQVLDASIKLIPVLTTSVLTMPLVWPTSSMIPSDAYAQFSIQVQLA